MTHPRRLTPHVLLLALAALLTVGCQTDPVTRGQQVLSLSDSAVSILWQFDDENRPLMRASFPEAHAFVEATRKRGSSGLRSYDEQWNALYLAVTAYEATGSPDDAVTLKERSDAVADIADQARAYLLKLQAAHPDKVNAAKARAPKSKVSHG